MKPVRIQRKRSSGWKMPENTVSVCRPGIWGNPFIVNDKVKPGSKSGAIYYAVPTVEDAVECFRLMLEQSSHMKAEAIKQLRGKNLACFCPLGSPCHADVLLGVVNE